MKTPFNVLRNRPMAAGAIHTKDAPADIKTLEAGMESMGKEVTKATELMGTFLKDRDESIKQVKDLQESIAGRKEIDDETKNRLTEVSKSIADSEAKAQSCVEAIEMLKKQMDQPIYQGGKDLQEKDREAAISLQKHRHQFKGGLESEFKADMDNLINPADYRSAMQKMQKLGLESKSDIKRTFTPEETKAFEAASLDSAFFMPEMLGMEVDCEIECASLLDLYEQVSVSRSTFMFPHVESYGDIGTYDCDAKCDAEYGPEGNITWKNGNTTDYRGAFCFNRDTLREANYDLLGFMMRAISRSYRINRNAASITGNGVTEPLGWLTADAFTKLQAPNANPTHQDLRQFLASAPVEYGDVTSVMHQNTFAFFASMVDNNGRFIFGDGLMGFSPSNVSDRIRISNCLPDPTAGGTLGSAASPFATGSFVMAAGVWPRAYANVSHRPMFMEVHEGGSSAWCVQYQFGAKDGGFIACAPAARTFQAG